MSAHHSTLLLGAYVLGSLDPAERRQVELHVRDCSPCAAELSELAPLRALLRKIDPDELGVGAVSPSPDLFTRLSVAADAALHRAPELNPDIAAHWEQAPTGATALGSTNPPARSAANRSRRRWAGVARRPRVLIAAAAVVVLASAGISTTTWAVGHHADSTYSAAAGRVHMHVTVTAATTGTTLRVTVAGLPVHEHCTLVAVALDGSRHVAGQWVATYAGQATVTGSTDVARGQLKQLILLGRDGHQLITVPV